MLWEPRRVVPSFAVPIDDVAAELVTAGAAERAEDDTGFRLPVYRSGPCSIRACRSPRTRPTATPLTSLRPGSARNERGPSPVIGDGEIADLAWTYRHPLREANEITGLIAFFDERVDVVVDGERRERPITPWS
jgi:hypothetical protein